MTKRKTNGPTRIELNRARLRHLATQLLVGAEISSADRDWLALALMTVGEGGDANEALEVKARAGERTDPEGLHLEELMTAAMSAIAAAMEPSDGSPSAGLGLSEDDAFGMVAKHFTAITRHHQPKNRIDEEKLRNHWNAHPEKHTRSFREPISAYPVVRNVREPNICSK